ncbi:hypothetical protein LPB41_23460 [Thalassospira sp. MA62]|nr:hypothetical protein [Thalassospira sp. MA62]
MELTFSTKLMRDLAADSKKAYKQLGAENGQAFIGVIADFRAAVFAGDVPGDPTSTRYDDLSFQLDWVVSSNCTLHTVVMVVSATNNEAWRDCYRIRLDAVTLGKEIIS